VIVGSARTPRSGQARPCETIDRVVDREVKFRGADPNRREFARYPVAIVFCCHSSLFLCTRSSRFARMSPAIWSRRNCRTLVFVEGSDHPVPVAEHGRHGEIGVVARGIGVAHHVQPVASPLFAVLLAGEQAVDDLLERGGRLVLKNASTASAGWQAG